MAGLNLEILRYVPQEFGEVGSEVPGYEIERAYAYPDCVEKTNVMNRLLGEVATSDTGLAILPFLIEKQALVWKYETGGKKFSVSENLFDERVVVGVKGKKNFVKGTNGEDGLAVVRQETKRVVVSRDPIEVAMQELALDRRNELKLVGHYLRKKLTGVVVDENFRAYLINLDDREHPDNDESIPGQIEVEYFGTDFGRQTSSGGRQEVCNGVLMVSNRVAAICEGIGLSLTPKDQRKKFLFFN